MCRPPGIRLSVGEPYRLGGEKSVFLRRVADLEGPIRGQGLTFSSPARPSPCREEQTAGNLEEQSSFCERILDRDSLDHLTVRQVLGKEHHGASAECSLHDQGVPEG